MEEKGKKSAGKIIFVNSFKGGAGKTTLSLTHCISGLFQEGLYKDCHYENVIYMDMDILGTGTCYLFDEEKITREACFDRTGKPVEIKLRREKEERRLFVAFLDPLLKHHSSFGEEYFINHQMIATEKLKDQVIRFLQKNLEEEPSTLVVIDCAPGFSELEQKLLEACYELARKKKLAVEEDYVTTLDTAHIRKCIQCLNDSRVSFGRLPETRTMYMVLNDVQNFVRYIREEEKGELDVQLSRITEEIKKSLHDRIGIRFWRYSPSVALRTTFTREQSVENQVDDYIFTGVNYINLLE